MTEELRPFRFLQLSDVVLDARSSFKKLAMPAAKRFERNAEALEAVLHMCEVARSRLADAVIINGNLWEGASVTAATVGKLAEAFASLEEIPVLITPGLGDPLSAQSFYNLRVLSAHAIRHWSPNVHVFASPELSAYTSPRRPDVCLWGRANNGLPDSRRGPLPALSKNHRFNILLDYQPFDESLEEALMHFDYAAFGGTPNYRVYATRQGELRGASGGSLLGRSLDELGPRCALWVELGVDGDAVRVERIPADKRMLTSVCVSINGIKAAGVAEHIRKVVEATGARQQIDLVHVKLTGIYSAGQPPETGESQLAKQYYHARSENATRPDYFIDKADQRTTTGRFIQVLQELKNLAEARGGVLSGTEYGANLTARDIEDALYYGLEALNHKKVTVPDVD